jgi:hypothetical protein
MEKRLLLFLTLLCALELSCAQGLYVNTGISDLFGDVYRESRIKPENPNISGSPYLNDQFVNGIIYYDGKYKVDNIPLRLNICLDELEYKNRNTVLAVAEPTKIDSIVIDNTTFIYIPSEKHCPISGFVKLSGSELPAILTKYEAVFRNKEPAKPYGEPKPDRYERAMDRYYLLKADREVSAITSVKKLIKSMGDHEDELKTYAKEHKTSASDLEELIILVDFFHTLQ